MKISPLPAMLFPPTECRHYEVGVAREGNGVAGSVATGSVPSKNITGHLAAAEANAVSRRVTIHG
ncbi:hypothetical protein [Budvicia aquatica]|uniref:hypothetical protein n=1 Tax=Budvicia aquatica TaxID=82979 RepID=UPI00106D95B5|nr:hypothetical protein [Budvicia aquatica]